MHLKTRNGLTKDKPGIYSRPWACVFI